jgi:hypothetical protein
MVRKFALLFLIATPAFGQDCDGIYRDPNWLPLHMSNDYLQVVTPDHWHLLTKSHVGTISLLKNLTEHECQFARARVLGLPATKDEIAAAKKKDEENARATREHPESMFGSGWTNQINPGDIETAECFE